MLRSELYLKDILRAISLIEKSTKRKDFKKFKADKELIDATAMRIQIIGESIKKLPSEIKRKNKNINWKRYLEMRNVISHAYFIINEELLWSIVKEEIPKLKKEIQMIK